jgi:glyoxylase-like metal-dependent hydrolase (beta-lactamase superfamily II)
MSNRTAWTDLEGGVRVRRSAAFQMNSVVLLDAEHSVVVDPGVLPSELDDLAREVRQTAPQTLTLAFTHAHWDHVLGGPWWPEADTLAHDRFAATVKRDAGRILTEAQELARQHGESWSRGFTPLRPRFAVSGLRFMKLGSWRLVARDAPGHANSQLTFHLPDRGVLIAADMLSDIEPPTLDGPVGPYLETLRGLKPLADGGAITTLVPGHGSIANGSQAVRERLERDLDYLERLEREVAQARAEGLGVEAARDRLSGMEVPCADASPENRGLHLENVAVAIQAHERPAASRG